jgi:hypothetical protein
MVRLASLRPYLVYIIELHVIALVTKLSPAYQFDTVFCLKMILYFHHEERYCI